MKHIHTFESFINEATNKMVTKQDWDNADDEQRENWLLSAIKDPADAEKYNRLFNEVAVNKRMDIIGQNGNEGTHYEVKPKPKRRYYKPKKKK